MVHIKTTSFLGSSSTCIRLPTRLARSPRALRAPHPRALPPPSRRRRWYCAAANAPPARSPLPRHARRPSSRPRPLPPLLFPQHVSASARPSALAALAADIDDEPHAACATSSACGGACGSTADAHARRGRPGGGGVTRAHKSRAQVVGWARLVSRRPSRRVQCRRQ